MNSRLREFDVLRVVATLSVIGIHITAGYVLNYRFAFFCNQFVRFAVPLFIIMSGFLLYSSDLNRGLESATTFYKRRFTKVLFPYIIWSTIYFIVNLYISGERHYTVNFLALLGNNLMWGKASYHLYFMIIIFQLYLLYPIFRKWFSQSPFMLLIASFLLTFVTQTILYFNMIHVLSFSTQYNDFYLVAFPVWMLYFILGMFSACKKDRWEQTFRNNLMPLTLIWVVSLLLLILDGKYTLTYGSSIRPTVILYTVITYYFFYALAIRFNHIKGPWLSWMANQSFLIFLMHPLFLLILVRLAPKIGLPDLWSGNAGMVLIYLFTAVFTLSATYLISLTPLASWLGGVIHKGPDKLKPNKNINQIT